MFPLPYLGHGKKFNVEIHNLELNQFCKEIDKNSFTFTERPICTVSNKAILQIINNLCNTDFIFDYNCSRKDIKFFADENIFIVIQSAFRINEEDKIDNDTLMHFIRNRNIVFFKVVIKE